MFFDSSQVTNKREKGNAGQGASTQWPMTKTPKVTMKCGQEAVRADAACAYT